MKTPQLLALLLASAASALAVDTTLIEIVVSGIPAKASEVIVVITAGPPAVAPSYDEPAATVAVPVVAPAAPEEAAQKRRRRNANAAPLPTTRLTIDPHGSTSTTIRGAVPVGENYHARVVALHGTAEFPVVLAGGRLEQPKLSVGGASLNIALAAPTLQLAPETPASVAPGAQFQVAGVITDGSRSLGTKDRMRIWISEGTAPSANFSGRQTSTIDVTREGDDVAFKFELTAPKQPTTLYFQFGELPVEFARADGKQAAFLVLPDLSTGARPLQIAVR